MKEGCGGTDEVRMKVSKVGHRTAKEEKDGYME